ncbi:monocarboxylate transporter 6-like isoform X1 [Pleurodeles waltl]
MATGRAQEVTDQGWAWVVLLAVVLSQGLSLGFPSCIGVFYTDIQASFQASNSETSWFPSIVTAVQFGGGPVCSILVERYGCRVTVFIGGILAGVGMVASSFAQTIIQLYVTAGFIAGLGLCLSFQAAITVLGYYFVRHRTLANSLASMGASIGMAVWPLMSQYLLDLVGWRGTFLIFGGTLLNCCVCGAVMRPISSQPSSPRASTHPTPESIQNENLSPPLASASCFWISMSSCSRTLQKYMAFDLLCHNKQYRIYTIGNIFMVLGFVLLVYLVPYATASGIEESKAAMLLGIIGFINIFVRPVAGIISQMAFFKDQLFYLFCIALMVNGASNVIAGLWASYAALVLFCVVYSVSISFVGSLVFQVLMDIVGMERFPSAFGLFTTLESIAILIGPPLAGLLVDITGHYHYVFHVTAVIVCSSAVFMGLSAFVLKRKEAKLQGAAKLAPREALMDEAVTPEQAPEVVFVRSI